MKKDVKLYNVIFPIWMLLLFPQMWFISLPANFIIDLLVIWLTMKLMHVQNIKSNAKAIILKTWIAGFGADFVGGFLMFVVPLLDFDYQSEFGSWWYENMTNAVMYNPFETIPALLWTTLCVIITAILIYFINKKWCLKNAELTEEQKKKIALSLAVFTAPYLFYLPTKLFW